MVSKIKNIVEHSARSEKSIEAYLVRRVRDAGGACLKYYNPNEAGYPDRLCILPRGVMFFVELKSKGAKPRALQLARNAQLTALGVETYVVDSRELVDRLLMFKTASV